MEKKNEFQEFMKNKNIATKKESQEKGNNTSSDANLNLQAIRPASFAERTFQIMKSMLLRSKKYLFKGYNYFFVIFSLCAFIGGPAFLEYQNRQFYEWIKLNGGFRKETSGGGQMRM